MTGSTWLYAVAPIFTWCAAGGCKFLVNSWRMGGLAIDRIGMGGAPSTHTSIVTATLVLVWLLEGAFTPTALVALTLAWIVVIDATDLRRKVGQHAGHLQRLFPNDPECQKLRLSIGHTIPEIGAGIAVGTVCGFFLYALSRI